MSEISENLIHNSSIAWGVIKHAAPIQDNRAWEQIKGHSRWVMLVIITYVWRVVTI